MQEAEENNGEKLEKLSGFIFMCNGKTKPECYKYRVFGLPVWKSAVVEKIQSGMKLFLFDFEVKLLYGIYEATSGGKLNVEPAAFCGSYPAQVKFKIYKDCMPVPESSFRHAIQGNYQKGKFRQELNEQQVQSLLSLFQPLTVLGREFPRPMALPMSMEHKPGQHFPDNTNLVEGNLGQSVWHLEPHRVRQSGLPLQYECDRTDLNRGSDFFAIAQDLRTVWPHTQLLINVPALHHAPFKPNIEPQDITRVLFPQDTYHMPALNSVHAYPAIQSQSLPIVTPNGQCYSTEAQEPSLVPQPVADSYNRYATTLNVVPSDQHLQMGVYSQLQLLQQVNQQQENSSVYHNPNPLLAAPYATASFQSHTPTVEMTAAVEGYSPLPVSYFSRGIFPTHQ